MGGYLSIGGTGSSGGEPGCAGGYAVAKSSVNIRSEQLLDLLGRFVERLSSDQVTTGETSIIIGPLPKSLPPSYPSRPPSLRFGRPVIACSRVNVERLSSEEFFDEDGTPVDARTRGAGRAVTYRKWHDVISIPDTGASLDVRLIFERYTGPDWRESLIAAAPGESSDDVPLACTGDSRCVKRGIPPGTLPRIRAIDSSGCRLETADFVLPLEGLETLAMGVKRAVGDRSIVRHLLTYTQQRVPPTVPDSGTPPLPLEMETLNLTVTEPLTAGTVPDETVERVEEGDSTYSTYYRRTSRTYGVALPASPPSGSIDGYFPRGYLNHFLQTPKLVGSDSASNVLPLTGSLWGFFVVCLLPSQSLDMVNLLKDHCPTVIEALAEDALLRGNIQFAVDLALSYEERWLRNRGRGPADSGTVPATSSDASYTKISSITSTVIHQYLYLINNAPHVLPSQYHSIARIFDLFVLHPRDSLDSGLESQLQMLLNQLTFIQHSLTARGTRQETFFGGPVNRLTALVDLITAKTMRSSDGSLSEATGGSANLLIRLLWKYLEATVQNENASTDGSLDNCSKRIMDDLRDSGASESLIKSSLTDSVAAIASQKVVLIRAKLNVEFVDWLLRQTGARDELHACTEKRVPQSAGFCQPRVEFLNRVELAENSFERVSSENAEDPGFSGGDEYAAPHGHAMSHHPALDVESVSSDDVAKVLEWFKSQCWHFATTDAVQWREGCKVVNNGATAYATIIAPASFTQTQLLELLQDEVVHSASRSFSLGFEVLAEVPRFLADVVGVDQTWDLLLQVP